MGDATDKAYPTTPFPKVIPEITDWPIYQISQDREGLVEEVVSATMQVLYDPDRALSRVADAYYHERIRMKDEPWKVDRKDEPAFWKRIRARLQASAQSGQEDPEMQRVLMEEIVARYANEVAGDFRPGTYHFARRILNYGFSRLFKTANVGFFRGLRKKKKVSLLNKMQLHGQLEQLRSLTEKGTVILVPTHFSNLDSIVIGWAIEALGLPAFTYGAGINLFGHPVLSYFMGRLGAFRVDRRKKNELYLTTLKAYTEMVLRKGAHMLFFPGGTRSRSGSIETRLKLGLLGTAIDAQRHRILEDPSGYKRYYVVPLVMSYHTVLEANSLVSEFLRREGKERFVLLQDDFQSMRKTMRYVWKFLGSSSEMVFSFGKPMDLFGNAVNEAGISIDKNGRELDLADYYRSGGEITHDPQRSKAYTQHLGDEILRRYYEINVVFSSHLLAFAALQIFLKKGGPDIYNLLTIPEEDLRIPYDTFCQVVDRLHVRLRELELAGKVRLAEHMHTDIPSIIEHGIRNLGVYHVKHALKRDDNGDIVTENMRLLYFYNNRMNGYDLAKYC